MSDVARPQVPIFTLKSPSVPNPALGGIWPTVSPVHPLCVVFFKILVLSYEGKAATSLHRSQELQDLLPLPGWRVLIYPMWAGEIQLRASNTTPTVNEGLTGSPIC